MDLPYPRRVDRINEIIENIFSVTNIKMKYRDYFDKYSEHRVGWRRDNLKLDEIVNELKNSSKIELGSFNVN